VEGLRTGKVGEARATGEEIRRRRGLAEDREVKTALLRQVEDTRGGRRSLRREEESPAAEV
jgi:hypothetical protein